jgi:hypothetical protein
MSNHIYAFLCFAGPEKSLAEWAMRIDASRQTFKDGKGSHWGEAFGLFDPYRTVTPRINDETIAHNPPPGEVYATLRGFWLGRQWTSTEVGLPLGTIASLFPDLTISFYGEHYEEQGMRGLWMGGECVVFDIFDPIDDGGDIIPGNVERCFRSAMPIPDYYAPFFINEIDVLPDWDDLPKSIECRP